MITTTNVRIEVGASNHNAWADVGRACSGFVSVIKFTPAFGGGFFLAHRIEDPKYKALIIAPESKWAGDITNEGWVIEHEITDAGLIAAITPKEGSMSFRIYYMNDCEWWMASSAEEAQRDYLNECGYEPEDEMIEEGCPRQLTEEELDKRRFKKDDGTECSFREEMNSGPQKSRYFATRIYDFP